MIQRIQSVYLLLVVVLMGVVTSLPLGIYTGVDGGVSSWRALGIDIAGVGHDGSCGGLFVIALLSAIIALATVFLYKNRKLQVRLTVFNILLIIGWYAVFVAFAMVYKKQLGSAVFHCSTGCVLPLIAVFFNLSAIRGIRKDERLVRAADRLR